jgi:hypothetical protein
MTTRAANFNRAVAQLYLKNALGEATVLKDLIQKNAVAGTVSRDEALTFSDFTDRATALTHQVADTLRSVAVDLTPFGNRLQTSAAQLETRRVRVWHDLQDGCLQFHLSLDFYEALYAYIVAVAAGTEEALVSHFNERCST